MTRKFLCFSFFLILFLSSTTAQAVIKYNRSPYELPSAVPAQINGFRYIAGVKHVDDGNFSQDYMPRIWVDLTKKELIFSRQRIDQKTLNSRFRKLETVVLERIAYKKIEEVWYGEDALKKLAVTRLPTVSNNIWDTRSNSYRSLEIALDQRYRAPVVILYKLGRKKRGSIIVTGPNDKSYALYKLLMSKINTK